jgi:hypothetical protein
MSCNALPKRDDRRLRDIGRGRTAVTVELSKSVKTRGDTRALFASSTGGSRAAWPAPPLSWYEVASVPIHIASLKGDLP